MAQAQSRVLTAHVPLPLAEKIDAAAARLERPKGWIIKQALLAWLDQEEERKRLTLEAMEEVDQGNVIEQDAVMAWAESLSGSAPLPLPKK
ncbi:ribbon-helix-helix domain-containing protein [Pantoea sp.]|uniref:CopG family ribbon-helix-helix protein n=1 Tax=Pantoea sp. TaxID=69393 RepID=UPI00289F5BB8|nr:ribbon-helix-helix domain-containing protein [Pantoea sp.]